MGEPTAQERRDLEISLLYPDLANECFNKAAIEVHADDHRGEFILYYEGSSYCIIMCSHVGRPADFSVSIPGTGL
jgi:hypothetical protein